jgi:hypothetical protein
MHHWLMQEGSIMSDSDQSEKSEQPETAGTSEKTGKAEVTEKTEMTETLERWSAALAGELGIPDVELDIDAILALAGVAAHAVLRPAAPVTTYLVGYAAGRAAALDAPNAEQATARAADIAADLARRHEK